MFGEVEIRAYEQMTISASHTRDGRVLARFSVFDGQGKLWGQV